MECLVIQPCICALGLRIGLDADDFGFGLDPRLSNTTGGALVLGRTSTWSEGSTATQT